METSKQIAKAILTAHNTLQSQGEVVTSNKWQAIESPDKLYEVTDLFLSKLQMPETIAELELQTQADMPWSENHFLERISGIPSNPGYEYQNWPYYKPEKHNGVFRAEAEQFFSHTYMERFWPDKSIVGTGAMKYPFGDFNDLIMRLINDPGTRQAFFAIWHPSDQSNSEVRLPCTIGYHFTIRKDKLNVTYLIRSCDILRHFRNDIYLTVRLAQYVRDMVSAMLPGITMGHLSMWIGSLHCFNSEKGLLPVKYNLVRKHNNL